MPVWFENIIMLRISRYFKVPYKILIIFVKILTKNSSNLIQYLANKLLQNLKSGQSSKPGLPVLFVSSFQIFSRLSNLPKISMLLWGSLRKDKSVFWVLIECFLRRYFYEWREWVLRWRYPGRLVLDCANRAWPSLRRSRWLVALLDFLHHQQQNTFHSAALHFFTRCVNVKTQLSRGDLSPAY